ncbi:MAG: YccF domain-containing protein [Acholeplasmataceae bacterium]|nr:YccF domain-containing protein [Acholeplasmataceae bacterium]
MKTLGNIIWLVFGGLISAFWYFVAGVIFYITIIGIPFGKQCFKIGKLYLLPFGKEVMSNFNKHPVANIIWLMFFGWELFVGSVVLGVLFCITIIGIPFGKQWFKLALLSLFPFGAQVK